MANGHWVVQPVVAASGCTDACSGFFRCRGVEDVAIARGTALELLSASPSGGGAMASVCTQPAYGTINAIARYPGSLRADLEADEVRSSQIARRVALPFSGLCAATRCRAGRTGPSGGAFRLRRTGPRGSMHTWRAVPHPDPNRPSRGPPPAPSAVRAPHRWCRAGTCCSC
jgi:hypothetical protein